MGRYDEAREAAARLGQASGSNVRQNSSLALLEANCGRLDEALALAKTVPPEDHQYDSMRAVMASAYRLKGEFAQAIETLMYQPAGISKFYRSEELEQLNRSPEGSKFLELQGRKLAGVYQPARWIMLAGVYLDQEAFENADHALDEAEKSLGSNRVLQISYCRTLARSHAAQGKSREADGEHHPRPPHDETISQPLDGDGNSSCDWPVLLLAPALRRGARGIDRSAAFCLTSGLKSTKLAYWIARLLMKLLVNPGDAMPYYRSKSLPTQFQVGCSTSRLQFTI